MHSLAHGSSEMPYIYSWLSPAARFARRGPKLRLRLLTMRRLANDPSVADRLPPQQAERANPKHRIYFCAGSEPSPRESRTRLNLSEARISAVDVNEEDVGGVLFWTQSLPVPIGHNSTAGSRPGKST